MVYKPKLFDEKPTKKFIEYRKELNLVEMPCVECKSKCSNEIEMLKLLHFEVNTRIVLYKDPKNTEKASCFTKYCRQYLVLKRSSKARTIRRSNAKGKHTKQDLIEIATFQEHKCYFCDKKLDDHPFWPDPSERGKIAHWDHLKSLKKGGSEYPSNMALTCRSCNLDKGDFTESQYWKIRKIIDGNQKVSELQKKHKAYNAEKRKLDYPNRPNAKNNNPSMPK